MTATEPVYWEPFEARFAIDPYPTYARLREEFEAKLAAAVQDGHSEASPLAVPLAAAGSCPGSGPRRT